MLSGYMEPVEDCRLNICVPASLPRPCTAGPDSMHTHAHTHIVRKKLRYRCLFMCVKEQMWTETRALYKDGERREDQKIFDQKVFENSIICYFRIIYSHC